MIILFSVFILITQQFLIGHQGNHDQAANENIKTGMVRNQFDAITIIECQNTIMKS